MKKIFYIAFISLLISGCGQSQFSGELDEAQSMIENNPDSALVLLSEIKPDLLKSEKDKARYSLLKSMALDKNYIDTTTFDILQPAIDYYLENGTADEKLRTYYYQGRIFQNANDNDAAMNSFILALDQANVATDSLTIARTLVAQAFIYKDVYNINEYASNFLNAASICGKLNQKRARLDCLMSAWNGYILEDNKTKADSLMTICEVEAADDNINYNSQKLSHMLKYGSDNEIKLALNDFDTTQIYSHNDKLNIANAYNRVGEPLIAKHIIEGCQPPIDSYERLKYEGIYYVILDSLRDFEGALRHYQIFSQTLENVHSATFESKVQFSEEKHKLEIESQKNISYRNRVIFICLGAVLLLLMGVVILFLAVRSNRSQKALALERMRISNLENENLRHQIDLLEIEKDNLSTLLESQSSLPDEVKQTIKIRIEMLNSLLASQISSNEQYEKSYEKWMSDLTANIDEFMNSNRIAFKGTHPLFIKYFEDHGLSTDEINYVCLYAIGLKGKEVGSYIKKPSHVNISSAIRKKLGIDKHETNIGIYVRRLLASL